MNLTCVICGKPMPKDAKHVDTCGERCYKRLLSRQRADIERDTLKPGTRCECEKPTCPAHVTCGGSLGNCGSIPARLVEVTKLVHCDGKCINGWQVQPMSVNVTSKVWMCEPCAAFHESKVKA